MIEQRPLDWDPPAKPLPSLADPTVHPDDERPLKESALRMYERILKGPATNRELEAVGAGERISARRTDLNEWFERRHMPYFIPLGKRVRGRGVTLYWLTVAETGAVVGPPGSSLLLREEVDTPRTDDLPEGDNPPEWEEL